MPEIFCIPFNGKNIIYAPLKRLAFIGNNALVSLLSDMMAGKTPENTSGETARAIDFIKNTGILLPDPILPEPQALTHYRPICATLFLTNRCNLQCIYCYASGGELSPVDMPIELATHAIDIVCDNAMERGLQYFNLGFHGGGEPTLNWKVLTKAVAYTRKKPIKADVSASSNGYYTKEKLAYILKNFDSLSLSFDGPPEIQNVQRPVAGNRPSFSTVMKTIGAMDKKSFSYGIRTTITTSSVEKLPLILDFLCNNIGVKLVQVEPAFPRGRGEKMAIGEGEVDSFVKSFIEAYKLAKSKGVELFYSGARLDTLTTRFCGAPCDALVVLQTGEVSTCFEVHNVNHPLAKYLIFGKIQDGKLQFDESKWRDTVNRDVGDISYCEDCFCKYHCAGDCISKTFFSDSKEHFKPSVRCQINRELTKYLILRRIADNKGVFM